MDEGARVERFINPRVEYRWIPVADGIHERRIVIRLAASGRARLTPFTHADVRHSPTSFTM